MSFSIPLCSAAGVLRLTPGRFCAERCSVSTCYFFVSLWHIVSLFEPNGNLFVLYVDEKSGVPGSPWDTAAILLNP